MKQVSDDNEAAQRIQEFMRNSLKKKKRAQAGRRAAIGDGVNRLGK